MSYFNYILLLFNTRIILSCCYIEISCILQYLKNYNKVRRLRPRQWTEHPFLRCESETEAILLPGKNLSSGMSPPWEFWRVWCDPEHVLICCFKYISTRSLNTNGPNYYSFSLLNYFWEQILYGIWRIFPS